MKVYYADCDQFDDHQTGYHATPEAAIEAFWSETSFSENEQSRVVLYTRECEIDDELLVAAWHAQQNGSPSPALSGMAANVELDCDGNLVTYRLAGHSGWDVLCKADEIPSLVIS